MRYVEKKIYEIENNVLVVFFSFLIIQFVLLALAFEHKSFTVLKTSIFIFEHFNVWFEFVYSYIKDKRLITLFSLTAIASNLSIFIVFFSPIAVRFFGPAAVYTFIPPLSIFYGYSLYSKEQYHVKKYTKKYLNIKM